MAKERVRSLCLFPALCPSPCFCSHETIPSWKSQDKYLCFLNLEGVTHLFSTASHFPHLMVQVLLKRPEVLKDKLWLRSLRPGNFSWEYEPRVCGSRKCLSHIGLSLNLLKQDSWLGSVGGTLCELACLSEIALQSDSPYWCNLQFSIMGIQL